LLVYVLILLIPAAGALLLRGRHPAMLMAFGFILAITIGLRDHVGMDWNNYLAIHLGMTSMTLGEALRSTSDPGFSLLAWSSQSLGYGIYGSNLVAAIVFSFGLISFALKTKNPFMAITAAVPYLVIVIAMSVERQSIAIGILLFALSRWKGIGTVQRIVLILMAATFHISAVAALGFVVVDSRVSLLTKTVLVSVIVAIVLTLAQGSDQLAYYSDVYLDSESTVESAGALAHVALIAFPAILFLAFRRKWEMRFGRDRILLAMSLAALAALPAALVFSTAVDRVSLYLVAVPLLVYSNLPNLFASPLQVRLTQGLIVGLNFGLLFAWLLLANSAFAYLPYKNLLL
jgi:hypothetical protein